MSESNEMKLLKAFIDAAGYDVSAEFIRDGEYEYKVSKRKVQPRSAKDCYSEQFETVWRAYPNRAGANPKQKSYMAYNKRIQDGDSMVHEIYHGVQRYAAYCEATEKLGTEFVMQAATFFGPDQHFLNSWHIAEKPKQLLKLPRDNEKLEGFCREHGLPTAYPAEGWSEWRGRLESHIEAKQIYQ